MLSRSTLILLLAILGSIAAKPSPVEKVLGADSAASEALGQGVPDPAPVKNVALEADSPWKSGSEGLIQTGRAEELTHGIRVEDIVEPNQDYRFAAFGKSDPFIPPPKRQDAADETPIVSPLQRYTLNELGVVGVWQLPTGLRKAMVMTPKKEGIVVQSGDPIGRRHGKVLGINDDGIVVREYVLAPDGTRQFEDLPISLGSKTDSSTSETVPYLRPQPYNALQSVNANAVNDATRSRIASDSVPTNISQPAGSLPTAAPDFNTMTLPASLGGGGKAP